MQVVKAVQHVNSNEVCVHLPDEFIDKDIEIIITTIDKAKRNLGKESQLFNAFRLDTKGFKFNREEAHER